MATVVMAIASEFGNQRQSGPHFIPWQISLIRVPRHLKSQRISDISFNQSQFIGRLSYGNNSHMFELRCLW